MTNEETLYETPNHAYYIKSCAYECKHLDLSPYLSCGSGSEHQHTEIMLKAAIMHGVLYSSLTLFNQALLKWPGESLHVPK